MFIAILSFFCCSIVICCLIMYVFSNIFFFQTCIMFWLPYYFWLHFSVSVCRAGMFRSLCGTCSCGTQLQVPQGRSFICTCGHLPRKATALSARVSICRARPQGPSCTAALLLLTLSHCNHLTAPFISLCPSLLPFALQLLPRSASHCHVLVLSRERLARLAFTCQHVT